MSVDFRRPLPGAKAVAVIEAVRTGEGLEIVSVHKSPNRTLETARRLLADRADKDSGAGGAAGPSSGKLPVGEAPAGAASVKADFPTVNAAAERDIGPEGGVGKTGADAVQAKAPEGTHQPTDAGRRSGALEGKAIKQNIVQRGGDGQVAAVASEGLQEQAAEAAKRFDVPGGEGTRSQARGLRSTFRALSTMAAISRPESVWLERWQVTLSRTGGISSACGHDSQAAKSPPKRAAVL